MEPSKQNMPGPVGGKRGPGNEVMQRQARYLPKDHLNQNTQEE